MTWRGRLVLLLFPARFRERYGRDVLEAARLEMDAARGRPALPRAALAVGVAGDLLASAARQRTRYISRIVSRRRRPHLPPPMKRTEMDTILQDIAHALRQFVRKPGFTAIAVISLALGIGGSTLVYGLVDGLVLHPFAYPNPDRLVSIGTTFPKVSSDTTYVEAMSPAEYDDIKAGRAFSRIAAFDLGNRNLSGGDVPERVFTALLLDDPFPVLGVAPALGRGFTRDELAPDASTDAHAAIISHRLWQSRFNGDPHILSRAIRIGGNTATIVGVMPPGMLLIGTDLWSPWGGDPAQVPRNARQFTVLARLAPGVGLEQANAELTLAAARTDSAHRSEFKEYDGWRLTATPWADALMQDVRPAVLVMLGAVGFVLLIACANLANLLLARSTTRQRELAVRVALGAGRSRVARLLLTESLLLGLSGAALGLLLTWAGLRAAAAFVPPRLALLGLHATVSERVLAVASLLAIATGIAAGLLPAWRASRTDPQESLKADTRTGHARGAGRLRQSLVVAEIALSVVLLLGAGLLLRSFANMQRVDPGVDARGVLTMRLTLPIEQYRTGEQIVGFFEELIRRVESVPGVHAAAMASQFPPDEPFSSRIEVDGLATSGDQLPTAHTTIVSREYMKALGIPLVGGRNFADRRPQPGAPHQFLVNQAFAARYLSGRHPIGARVRIAGRGQQHGPWAEVIGVVGDARNGGIAAPPRPEIFVSMEHGRDQWNQLFLLVRADHTGEGLLASIRQAIASIDPEQPVYAIQTLEEAIATSSEQARVSSLLIGIFAAVALVLAAIGIYGVMSYSVSARRQEMGIRLAIGADRGDVICLVLRQVLWLSLGGLAIGIGLLLALGRLLGRLLYGVTASDPLTIAGVAALLGAVALVAAWVPALGASRVEPIQALRYE